MATEHEQDPHASHTPEQIDELQDALGHVEDALRHLRGDLLDRFDDPDTDEAIRHLREARMWLVELLVNAGHEPETDAPDADLEGPQPPASTPVH